MKRKRRRNRFLYEGYAKGAYFWEIVIMLRKVLLVIIIVFLKDNSYKSSFCGLWLLGIALFYHVIRQPMEKEFVQLLETLSLTVLLITLLMGMLSFEPYYATSPGEQTAVSVIVILINVLMIIILLACLSYHYYHMLANNIVIQSTMIHIRKRFSLRGLGTPAEGENVELEPIEKPNDINENEDMDVGGPVTVDKLKKGREKYRLNISDSGLKRDVYGSETEIYMDPRSQIGNARSSGNGKNVKDESSDEDE